MLQDIDILVKSHNRTTFLYSILRPKFVVVILDVHPEAREVLESEPTGMEYGDTNDLAWSSDRAHEPWRRSFHAELKV